MKVKIVYFSLDGNTKLVVYTIARALNADVTELKPVKPYYSEGTKKYIWGVKSVIFKEKPILQEYNKSNDYDLIIIGTPVWAGTFAPPIRTYLTENDLSGKNIGFFACYMRKFDGKCFDDLKEMQPNSNIISTTNFFEPMKNNSDEQTNIILKWANNLESNVRSIKNE